MVAYADSSFLTKLCLQEPASPAAIAAFGQVSKVVQAASRSAALQPGISLPVAHISELTFKEVRNALNSAVFDKRISASEAALALADLERDISSGLLSLSAITPATFARAASLSDRHACVANPHVGPASPRRRARARC